MRRVSLALLIALGGWVGSCSQRAPRPWAAAAGGEHVEKSLVGYLGHRGRLYRIEDVLDPAFRAQSDDPFLRDLDPRTMLAGPGWLTVSHRTYLPVTGATRAPVQERHPHGPDDTPSFLDADALWAGD